MAGGLGFEPRLAESESAVLPLDDPPSAGNACVSIRRCGCVAGRRCTVEYGMLKVNLRRGPSENGHGAYAAIDLGTNNCRLLVARPAPGGFEVVDAFSRVVRLGEGLSRSSHLRDDAMDRAISALRVCSRKMRRGGVQRARAVATEACRRANNGAAFLQRAEEAAGLPVETIDPDEEAGLALAGCRSLLSPSGDRGLLIDIGGGSTQVVWFGIAPVSRPPAVQVLKTISLPLGVVSLTERYGNSSPQDMFEPVDREISAHLRQFDIDHNIGSAIAANRVQAIGTSGTITTLAGLLLGLTRYERSVVDGSMLTCDQIEAVSRRLAGLTIDQRAELPCVGWTRAELVVAGCAIFSAICRLWPLGSWSVADRGLREGILLDLMVADGHL